MGSSYGASQPLETGGETFGVTQHDNTGMFKFYVACAATMYMAAKDTNVTRS